MEKQPRPLRVAKSYSLSFHQTQRSMSRRRPLLTVPARPTSISMPRLCEPWRPRERLSRGRCRAACPAPLLGPCRRGRARARRTRRAAAARRTSRAACARAVRSGCQGPGCSPGCSLGCSDAEARWWAAWPQESAPPPADCSGPYRPPRHRRAAAAGPCTRRFSAAARPRALPRPAAARARQARVRRLLAG